MITKEDCIGAIEGYPPHVVECMLDEQERQGNPRNIAVFQNKADAGYFEGGFTWNKSVKGPMFWSNIHNSRKFYICPKPGTIMEKDIISIPDEESVSTVETEEEGLVVGAPVMVTANGRTKEKRLLAVVDSPDGKIYICATIALYNTLITEGTNNNSVTSHRDGVVLIKPKPEKVKLTLKDISEGKGVGIPPELIEIVK